MKKALTVLAITMFMVSLAATFPLYAKKKKWKVSLNLHQVQIKTEPPSTTVEKVVKAQGNSFSDDKIAIRWKPKPKGFKIELDNKSGQPLIILWEKSFFVDLENKGHKLVHSKIKLEHDEKPTPPTTIQPKGKLKTVIFPRSYAAETTEVETVASFSTGSTSQYQKTVWKVRDIYPATIRLKEKQKEDKDFDIAAYCEKSEYRMVLAVKRNETLFNYHFYFKVTGK